VVQVGVEMLPLLLVVLGIHRQHLPHKEIMEPLVLVVKAVVVVVEQVGLGLLGLLAHQEKVEMVVLGFLLLLQVTP
jgi:hypothetical protein